MIELIGVCKGFGSKQVLRDVSLSVPQGGTTAVVGPNASGKTTLLRSILGLVRPTAGRILFDGAPLNGGADYRRRIGYMPQAASYPGHLSGFELTRMVSGLRGMALPGADDPVWTRFDLHGDEHRPFGCLSGGTRQKISALIAFLGHPEVLILDEPTAGLDPAATLALKRRVSESVGRGGTVLLATHIMSEVEQLADRLILLVDGTVRFAGTPDDLIEITGRPSLEEAVAALMTEAPRYVADITPVFVRS